MALCALFLAICVSFSSSGYFATILYPNMFDCLAQVGVHYNLFITDFLVSHPLVLVGTLKSLMYAGRPLDAQSALLVARRDEGDSTALHTRLPLRESCVRVPHSPTR